MVVAGEQVAVIVVEVQAGAFAVTPDFTVFTLAFLGPRAVAHHLEAILPHLPEVILVDVALAHVATHRGTAADAAIATDAGHLHTTATIEEMVAHLLLVLAKKPFAGVADVEDCLIA